MKKKIFVFLLAFVMILPCVVLLSACGEKKIRNIHTKLGDSVEYNRNLGGFEYSTGAQPALEELNKMSLAIEYSDDSWTYVEFDDAKVKTTIEYNGTTIEDFPAILESGSYTIKFFYDNSTTYAEVFFFVMASSNADYSITEVVNNWDYLNMPDFNYAVIENYTGADSVITFYYIDKNLYQRIINEDPNAFSDTNNLPKELENNCIITTDNNRIPVGNWYLFARVPYTNNYYEQLTKPFAITVRPSTLDSLGAYNDEISITAEYTFNGDYINNVPLSAIDIEANDFYAYNSQYPDDQVMLSVDDWANPNDVITCNDDNTTKPVKFKFTNQQDANNFVLNADVSGYNVDITVNKALVNFPSFAKSDSEWVGAATITEEKNDFTPYDLKFSNIFIDSFEGSLDNYENLFNVVEFYDVTNEESAQNINIYYENGTLYKNNNYQGPIKVVLKKSDGGETYIPTIEIEGNAIGTYNIQIKLKDKVNYQWGEFTSGYGSNDITLTINITKNATEASDNNPLGISIDNNNQGTINFTVRKEYFDTLTEADINIKSINKFNQNISNVTITEVGSKTITEAEDNPDYYNISITCVFEIDGDSSTNNILCYELEIQTKEDYQTIIYQGATTVTKINN